ncbi:MAG TPA: alanine racemase [Candidatus Paceibacterota bacterium]
MRNSQTKSRSWVEVDIVALRHNARAFRKLAHSTSSGQARPARLMAVVKSNAYGHGLIECAKLFEKWDRAQRSSKSEVGWFGVDDLDEALTLRRAGIKLPILVLGYTLPNCYTQAARENISVTVSSIDSLKHCLQITNCKFHIKLETGLNRQGITEDELPEALKFLTRLPVGQGTPERAQLEGVYSHFATAELADQKKYRDYCNKQMDRFERMAKQVERGADKKLIRHMAGTAATILLPRSRYDLVRIGIGMYGLDPSNLKPITYNLKPVLNWYSVIAQVKNVKKGERVGYDLTEKLTRDSKLAIVPVGYWHGYPRALNGKGEVLVRGKRCKVVGRISMDMMTVDVTRIPSVKAGDIVTLIGAGLSAEAVAAKAGTINYELVTRISPLLKRTYF